MRFSMRRQGFHLMSNEVVVCIKRVGKPAEFVMIEDSNEVLRDIIGGHFSGVHFGAYLPAFRSLPLMLLCHDEGKLLQLPPNFFFGPDLIVGDCVILRYSDDGETVSLDLETIALLNRFFTFTYSF